MFKAVIFDLDGTLVYTEPAYRLKTVGSTIQELGVKPKVDTETFVDKFWFEENRDEIIDKYLGVDPKFFWEVFRKYDLPEVRRKFTKPYEDVGIICELKDSGYKTGIVTGSPEHIARMELELLGGENFDVIIIANLEVNRIRPKPDPHGIELCLDRLGVPFASSVYVDNSIGGILAAREANVYDVMIDRKEYCCKSEVKPRMVIESLNDLKSILKLADR
jgi:beta-phosphoglucomutase-like phosphatase (HAD superfamily)